MRLRSYIQFCCGRQIPACGVVLIAFPICREYWYPRWKRWGKLWRAAGSVMQNGWLLCRGSLGRSGRIVRCTNTFMACVIRVVVAFRIARVGLVFLYICRLRAKLSASCRQKQCLDTPPPPSLPTLQHPSTGTGYGKCLRLGCSSR